MMCERLGNNGVHIFCYAGLPGSIMKANKVKVAYAPLGISGKGNT